MAEIASLIDGFAERVSPRWAIRRYAERAALQAVKRQYDAAATNRRTSGWRRTGGSADREVRQGFTALRNGASELCRNNKYAAAGKRQMLANLIGKGISARATHSEPKVAAAAQLWWENWAHGKVDGRNDFYGVQKLAAGAMLERGESLIKWEDDGKRPDARCRVLEGDYLDHLRNNLVMGAGRIVQGVQFSANGDRNGYWLYPAHPGDLGGYQGASTFYDAENIDHVFEELRPGQTRGVSWFAPVMMTLRDIGDYEDAVLMKKKVEACLAIILTPAEGNIGSPLAAQQPSDGGDPKKPGIETVRPGMIFRTRPGETATTLNPSSSGDGMAFVSQMLAGISANLVPHHLMSGDVSKANYSSLRAALLGFWAVLDDWQQNVIIPLLCRPAFDRQMRALALLTGDKRFLEVIPAWAVPPRRAVDPIKDVGGEIMEVRSGFKLMQQSMAERDMNWSSALGEMAAFNKEVDAHGLVLDTDPRKVNATGAIQPPASFAVPKGDPAGAQDSRIGAFFMRMTAAHDTGDMATLTQGMVDVADALQADDPMAPAMARVLRFLFDDPSDPN